MALQSDITVNYKRFDRSSISSATAAFNAKLQEIMTDIPKWYEVSGLHMPS